MLLYERNPLTIHMDGKGQENRSIFEKQVIKEKQMAETEKITINMNAVDLGKIDLLVQEGVYTNRTDFIRTAIRSQLERHSIEVQQSIARHSFGIGIFLVSRKDLENARAKGEKKHYTVIGLLNLADDIPLQLAEETIESIQVRGIFQASEGVKKVLADRMK